MQAKDPRVKVGSVLQIDPAIKDSFFAACLMTVTEVKEWGVQGFVCSPGKRGEMPGQAYTRQKWETVEYVGEAVWAPPSDDEESVA